MFALIGGEHSNNAQIRRGIRDNSQINFLFSRNIHYDLTLEPSLRDGSNEVLCSIIENLYIIIPATPVYLELWVINSWTSIIMSI